MSIENDAKEWMKSNKPKSKSIGNKTQRAQLAAIVLAGLIQSNPRSNEYELLRQAFRWADMIMENV